MAFGDSEGVSGGGSARPGRSPGQLAAGAPCLHPAPGQTWVPSPPPPPRPARRGLRVAHAAAAHLRGPEQGEPPGPGPPAPCSWTARGGGAAGPAQLAPQLSVAPQFLPRSLRVADLAANQMTEIFPLTFGEKPALR